MNIISFFTKNQNLALGIINASLLTFFLIEGVIASKDATIKFNNKEPAQVTSISTEIDRNNLFYSINFLNSAELQKRFDLSENESLLIIEERPFLTNEQIINLFKNLGIENRIIEISNQ